MCNYLLKQFYFVILIISIFSVVAFGDVTKDDLVVPEADNVQIITLNDGSTLVGRITKVIHNEVKFQTDLGEMSIAIDKIIEIKEVTNNSFRDGNYWFPNPNKTRLYIAPTGRMLNKGQGYIYDTWLILVGAAYGITDNITISAGISMVPGVSLSEQLIIINPKIGINSDGPIDFAVGGMFIQVPTDDPVTVGIINAMGTLGSNDNSFTFGLGYGYADGKLANKPSVILGGELRLSRRMSFVSENWIIPGVDDAIISYGIRFFGEKFSTDLAFFNILDEDAIFPGIPYVGIVWNF